MPSRKHALFLTALAASLLTLGGRHRLGPDGRRLHRPARPERPGPAPAPAAGAYVFPVAGPHTFGQGMGAARAGHSHMGQDIMAACGTPLVAVSRSTVVYRKWQGLAGNYLVLKDKRSGQSYFYAHLATPAIVRPRPEGPPRPAGRSRRRHR